MRCSMTRAYREMLLHTLNLARGIDVGVEVRHVVREIELGTARECDRQWRAVVLHLEDHGEGAGCMTRHWNERHRPFAKRDFLDVGDGDVALGLAVREPVDGFFDLLPVAGAYNDARPEAILHQLGAADLAGMGV